MTEAYANLTFTMRYYGTNEDNNQRFGAHIPFNFLLITDLNRDSIAPDFIHTINKWLTYMPSTLSEAITANWVVSLFLCSSSFYQVRMKLILFFRWHSQT